MIDTDEMLMNRALELARRGAGLVSPNPMVGAVLVKDGRVVGEGYHRYDLLKHAESYAIESAGELSRGATLYCSLEPCCHQGRTAPCTDALIEAGIARAVIAVKDPDPRVNGRGIEQLREAGIDVEVGLLEERALRLNEGYLKYIARGTPFVHSVIEYSADSKPNLAGWNPSAEFLRNASEYDAVMLGSNFELNRLVTSAAARLERHRPLVVAASRSAPSQLEWLRQRIDSEVLVVEVETERSSGAHGNVVSLDEGTAHSISRSPIGLLLATLARMQVTSVMILPGSFDAGDPANFREFDKVTLASPRALEDESLSTTWVYEGVEFDVEEPAVSEAGAFTELTGYPSIRGAA